MNENSKRALKGEELFKSGYNCSQALVGAFADTLNLDFETAMKMASAFGGGMGRLREVCGTVTGAYMVLGLRLGYHDAAATTQKAKLYAHVQEFAELFKRGNGSIICRDLLAVKTRKDCPTPDARTAEYYKKRPCVKLVSYAVALLEDILAKNGETISAERI